MSTIVNGKCWAERAPQNEPPIVQHGSIIFSAHVIGWAVSGVFALIAVAVSFWLISKHLTSYTNQLEQRYIVRLLFMVPLYAVISFASYVFWNHSNILLLLRDCYESTVLTAFFYLLLAYLSPDTHEQKDIFRKVGLSRENDREARKRGEHPAKWMFPLSFVRWKPADGLYFLQLMKWGVLQYCVIRPTTTLAAVILDSVGLYCADSWSPGWGHIYITVIMSASVTVAMYCLIQLYMPIAGYLAPHKPLLKLVAVKAVVFLTFWQATFIGFFEDFGVIKDTPYMTADNIANGISAICETFEMMIFAFVHIRAFTYKPYVTPHRTPRWRSLAHAFNFSETLRELWAGTLYMLHRARGRETDAHARREAALENIFGRSRLDIAGKGTPAETKRKEAIVVEVDQTVHMGGERQWLGTGDDYAYGIGYHMKRQQEKSDGLGDQIEKELSQRGYGRPDPRVNAAIYRPVGLDEAPSRPSRHSRGQSWWRNIYARLSRTSADQDFDAEQEERIAARPQRTSRSRSQHRSGGLVLKAGFRSLACSAQEESYDDPPPPSRIQTYRGEQSRKLTHADPGVPRRTPDDHVPLVSAFRTSSPRDMSEAAPVFDIPSSHPSTRPTGPTIVAPIPTRHSLSVDPALLSPPALSDRSDSFLGRAFTNLPDASSAEDSERSPGPSSVQSHHMQIRLAPEPEIISKNANAALSPIVTRSSLGLILPSAGMNDDVRSLQGVDIGATLERAGRAGAEVPRAAVRDAPRRGVAYSYNPSATMSNHPSVHIPLSRPGRDSQMRSSPRFLNKYTPSRDRIVLPARLAPSVTPGLSILSRDHSSPIASPPISNPTSPPPHKLPQSSRPDRDLPPLPPGNSVPFSAPPSLPRSSTTTVAHSNPLSDNISAQPASRRPTYNVKRKNVPRILPRDQDLDPISADLDAQHQRRSSRRVTAPPSSETVVEAAGPAFPVYGRLPQPALLPGQWRGSVQTGAERDLRRQRRTSRPGEHDRNTRA